MKGQQVIHESEVINIIQMQMCQMFFFSSPCKLNMELYSTNMYLQVVSDLTAPNVIITDQAVLWKWMKTAVTSKQVQK